VKRQELKNPHSQLTNEKSDKGSSAQRCQPSLEQMEQPVVQANAVAGQKAIGSYHLKTGHFYFALTLLSQILDKRKVMPYKM